MDETSKVNEQLNDLDLNKKEETIENTEESKDNTEQTKLSKGQKKRLKEKEKKLKQKQEQESGVATQSSATESTPNKPVVKLEPSKPETPAEKFNRQIEWAIYQLILGQQRKDTTKEQWKESETIINKLKSDKVHDARKIQLMHSVFGKNLDKVMKQYPLPKDISTIITKPEVTTTQTSESTTSTASTETSIAK